MSTAPHIRKFKADDVCVQEEFMKQEIEDQRDDNVKINAEREDWVTIASAKYSILHLDDSDNTGVKEELVDLSDEEFINLSKEELENELKREFVDLSKYRTQNESYDKWSNTDVNVMSFDIPERKTKSHSKVVTASISKKVQILKELENAKSIMQNAEKYGVKAQTISMIHERKEDIFSYVQDSIENEKDDHLKRTALPHSISLPMSKRIQVLEEREKGESYIQNSKRSILASCRIPRSKDKIQSFVHGSNEPGENCNLEQTNLPPPQKNSLHLNKVKIFNEREKFKTAEKFKQNNGVKAQMIINNIVKNSPEKGKVNNLMRTALPHSKRVHLPLIKKIEILEKLEKGETAVQLSKKYDVKAQTIHCVRKNKTNIENYVKNSYEKGEEKNLMRMSLPQSKRVYLPMSMKIEILEKLEKGESVTRLTQIYGVHDATIHRIQKSKNEILGYVHDSIVNGKEYNLKRTKIPHSNSLTMSKKIQILEYLEKGETTTGLAQKYGVAPQTIRMIHKNKDKIWSFVHDSIEKREDHLKRTTLPPSQRNNLTLIKKVKILEELEKGETAAQLAQKYGVKAQTIVRIRKNKTNIVNYVKNSSEKGEENNLMRISLPQSKRVHLPMSKKIEILEKLEKGESVTRLTQIYGVHDATIHRIQKSKNKILGYVHDSIEIGEEVNSKRVITPQSKKANLVLDMKVNSLEELEWRNISVRHAEKDGGRCIRQGEEITLKDGRSSKNASVKIKDINSKVLQIGCDALQVNHERINNEAINAMRLSTGREESYSGNEAETFSQCAKYSKLEIVDWQGNIVKEEHIDLPDEEEEKTNY